MSPSRLAALHTHGFAIVRNVLTPDEVERLAASFDDLITRGRAIANGAPEPADAKFVLDADPFRVHRVVWAGGVSPTIAALGTHPELLALAAEALGQNDLVQIIQQAHFKMPGDGVAFSWHQDASNRRWGTDQFTDVNGRGSFIQMAIAVDPMTRENGPLQMLPGSHRNGMLADLSTGKLPSIPEIEPVDILLEPGDVALFGPFVIHGSGPNTSPIPRRLFLQGFTLPGANHRVYPGCGTGVARRRVA